MIYWVCNERSVNIFIIQLASLDVSSEAVMTSLGNLLLKPGLQGVNGVRQALWEGQFKPLYKNEGKGPRLASVYWHSKSPRVFHWIDFFCCRKMQGERDGDCRRSVVRRRHRAVGEETPLFTPDLSPVWGAGNYRPPPRSPLVKINSTTRKVEHTHPYSQYLPKLLLKSPFPPPPDASRLRSWEACAALANPWAFQQETKHLAEGLTRSVVENNQDPSGSTTSIIHIPQTWFHTRASATSWRNVLCPCEWPPATQPSRDRNTKPTLKTSACVQASVTL